MSCNDDFEFEYGGFEDDAVTDHFDPNSAYGHYQTSKRIYHPDFTYEVDAVSMFEVMRDRFLPNNVDKISDSTLAAEFKKLNAADDEAYAALLNAKANGTSEELKAASYTYNIANEALELFIANNLKTFVDMFYNELRDWFEEDAYDNAQNDDNWLDSQW